MVLQYCAPCLHARVGESVDDIVVEGVRRVNGSQLFVTQQGQASQCEEGVKHIRHIPRSICKAAVQVILTAGNESDQLFSVNPVDMAEHFQAGQHPPRVTNVLQFIRTTVKPPTRQLPLAKPQGQTLTVVACHLIHGVRQIKRAHAAEHLAGMAFRARNAAKATVKVLTAQHVANCGVHVQQVGASQNGGAKQRTVREAGVNLAPLIACKTAIGTLQSGDVCDDAIGIDEVQLVVHGEDLDAGEGVQQMRVLIGVAREGSFVGMVAAEHVVENGVLRQDVQLAHEGEGGERPVHAGEALVVGEVESISGLGLLLQTDDVCDMQVDVKLLAWGSHGGRAGKQNDVGVQTRGCKSLHVRSTYTIHYSCYRKKGYVCQKGIYGRQNAMQVAVKTWNKKWPSKKKQLVDTSVHIRR